MSRLIKILLLVSLFIAFRLALFNLNAAEWGDSYHILRGARELTRFSYPLDEKRLPGFSALIAPFLFAFDPVVAGRVVVALATLAVLILSYKLGQRLFPDARWHLWLPVLLGISPVFLYWSLRVMAILPFTALVLSAFYIFYLRKDPSFPKGWFFPLLGVVLGIACLIRYEGFLLLPGFFLFYISKKRWREVLAVFIPWTLITLPWFVWSKLIAKGPAGAAYLSEAATFNLFDWERLQFWGLSVLFLFIFPPFAIFATKGLKRVVENNKGKLTYYLPLASFLILELALAFFWTPSVPRILIPVMPFLLMLFLEGFESGKTRPFPASAAGRLQGESSLVKRVQPSQGLNPILAPLAVLFSLYTFGQYRGRLYFLVLSRGGMGLVLGFSVLALVSLLGNRLSSKAALLLFAAVLAISSFVIVGNQRKIYSTVKNAAVTASGLDGKTAYFDETGVSWWYLNQLSEKGIYYPQDLNLPSDEQWQWLKANGVRHLLWTNEFNRGSALNIVGEPNYKDRFKVILEEEVEIADEIDKVLIKLGMLPERRYPVLRSVLYALE